MRSYELVCLLTPTLKETVQNKEISKLEKLIADSKGKIKKKEVWGKKDLAYRIKKYTQAIYLKFSLDIPSKNVVSFQTKMKLMDKIIRFLLIRVEE